MKYDYCSTNDKVAEDSPTGCRGGMCVESTRVYETYTVDIESCEVFDCTGPKYEKYPDLYGKTIVHICGE